MPGSTKYSISICSNSRIRKMKFPGVISFRKDFPIWAMPKGTFFRLTCWIWTKSTNMPWAVSGRRYTALASSSTGPMWVLNMRLKFRGSVNPWCPQFGHTGRWARSTVVSSSSWPDWGAWKPGMWSARNRWWHWRHSTRGSVNALRWPEASQTFGDMMIAASSPTTSSRSWTIERHQALRMFRFSSTPSGP
ncbi:hypothetical protein HRbin12_01412 [bacterium HR12]|nr:hypothetical protein HRbin12_01412 [bacterium HR12]